MAGISPVLTSAVFYWSDKSQGLPDSDRWRNRLLLLIREGQSHIAQEQRGGKERPPQPSLEGTTYHIGIVIIFGQKLPPSHIRRREVQENNTHGSCL